MNQFSFITQDNHTGFINPRDKFYSITDARRYVEPMAMNWFNNNPSQEFYSICVVSFDQSNPTSTIFEFQITRNITCTVY